MSWSDFLLGSTGQDLQPWRLRALYDCVGTTRLSDWLPGWQAVGWRAPWTEVGLIMEEEMDISDGTCHYL